MKTVIQELISEFETIQENHCKTLQERIFFDGVISIIESKYIQKEKCQIIESVDYGKKYHESFDFTAEQYYNETFK